MKLYKKNGEVFAFELDGSQDDLIASGMVAMSAAETDAHLNPLPEPLTPEQQLAESDGGMVRVIEDLINTLVVKGVISESELPAGAQQKLAGRQALREQMP